MNEQVADAKDRIAWLISDADRNFRTVFFYKYAVQRKRKRYPLVFFHAAVIMRIEHRHLCIFVQWILF